MGPSGTSARHATASEPARMAFARSPPYSTIRVAARRRARDRSNPCHPLESAPASGSAEPAVGHDQFDLLVLDGITPHFAAVGVDAAVAVDTVESRRADAHHDQRLVACRLEPIKRAVRQ